MTLSSDLVGVIRVGRTEEACPRGSESKQPFLLCLAAYALLAAVYVGLRFTWRWLPGDAAALTVLSQNVVNEATIAPVVGAYELGYGYPALNTFLASMTGLPVETLQVYVQPFLLVLLVPISYVAFRGLLGTSAVAMLASFLLLLQPDFLFEAVRSSHAKYTWLLALLMLYILSRSFRHAGEGAVVAKWILFFYLAAYALIASNVFFGSSYVFGLGFTFVGGWILTHWRSSSPSSSKHLRRLLYVTLACSVLVFLFIFYLYSPALRLTNSFLSVLDRVSGFLLDVETSSNPYEYVQATWLHPSVYVALTLLSWLVLGLSFLEWLRKGYSLLWQRATLPSHELLLWLIYTAFASLLVLSVFVDISGALSANLQVRIFPHLMVVAIPLAAHTLVRFLRGLRRRFVRAYRLATALLIASVLFFSVASLFKATNEPLLSNRWLYYSRAEQSAIHWAPGHLVGPWVWIGIDPRLSIMVSAQTSWQASTLDYYIHSSPVDQFDLLLSDMMEIHAIRTGLLLPNVHSRLKIYENGEAALYHARPKTPYQR